MALCWRVIGREIMCPVVAVWHRASEKRLWS